MDPATSRLELEALVPESESTTSRSNNKLGAGSNCPKMPLDLKRTQQLLDRSGTRTHQAPDPGLNPGTEEFKIKLSTKSAQDEHRSSRVTSRVTLFIFAS